MLRAGRASDGQRPAESERRTPRDSQLGERHVSRQRSGEQP